MAKLIKVLCSAPELLIFPNIGIKMIEKSQICDRVNILRKNAAQRYNITERSCHIGHIALEAMLSEPYVYNQIDAATSKIEINTSVAYRTCRLSSAMINSGLKPGDPVVIMGHNHLDLAIPFFACHLSGYPMCAIDPSVMPEDLKKLFPYINPKMVFCQKSCVEKVNNAYNSINDTGKIVTFDEKTTNLEAFIMKYQGTEVKYRPAEFDQSKIAAWLMLTSGTTGLPKVAVIPFDTLLNGIIEWWAPFNEEIETTMAMATLQWLSSLIYFISGPLKGYTRVQSSAPLTPQLLVSLINKYRPNVTAWTPYLLGQFLVAAENVCDLSCFKYIAIGGSAIEKQLLDRFRKKCGAYLYLVYGMTELLVPVFDFKDSTPFGSTGKPLDYYYYRLIDDNGQILEKPFKTGELWLRGNAFFKGYLNNPDETRTILTEDGWFKTGDIFYRDEEDNYFFVERRRLLIKHFGFLISPLQMEEIIKRHPGVVEACVVSIPDPECMELPIAAVVKRNGDIADPQEIFDLMKEHLPEGKQLRGGLFFVDSLPETPSGKIHRAKVKEMAFTAQRILSK